MGFMNYRIKAMIFSAANTQYRQSNSIRFTRLDVTDRSVLVKLLIKLWILWFMAVEVVCSETVTVPKTATLGLPFQLPCSTSLSTSVDWVCQFSGTVSEEFIYAEGFLVNVHKTRFSVNTTMPGQYDLLIFNVSVSDAGLYACVEDNGQGRRHEFIISVAVVGAIEETDDSQAALVVTVVVIVVGVAVIAAVAVVVIVLYQRGRLCKSQERDLEHAGQQLMSQPDQCKYKLPHYKTVGYIRKTSKKASLNDFLPKEVIKRILFRFIYRTAIANMKQSSCSDAEAVIVVRSVCSIWSSIVQDTRLRKKLSSAFNNICYPHMWHVRPLVTSDIKTNASIVGVAYLNGNIYVAYCWSNVLSVFRIAGEPRLQPEVLTIGTNEADVRAIVAWNTKDSLIVGDAGSRRLLQIDGTGNVEPWPSLMKHTSPRSLSTFKDRLLVATRRWTLKVYDLHGNRINSIRLDKSFDVSCTFMMPSTVAFVSVCVRQAVLAEGEADSDANVRLQRIFQQPFHAVFDDQCRCFFSDYEQCRVLLMLPGMTEHRVLLNGKYGGLKQPTKLCFAADLGQLFVCDVDRVRAFKVVQKEGS